MEPFKVRVWGPYACFTRPEFSVERLSYDVMTPSAARGVLEAIFWKPEFRWEIREIWVLKPIQHASFLRNEIGSRQGETPFFVEERRQQRTTRALKDVCYVIKAQPVLNPHATDNIAKYRDCFWRRVERGQYHHTPYLGTREFAASFSALVGDEVPIREDRDLGTLLFEKCYHDNPKRPEMEFWSHREGKPRRVKGWAEPLFFTPRLQQGKLVVSPDEYKRLEDDNA
jgi:CRISPR-associated protein Cas5d